MRLSPPQSRAELLSLIDGSSRLRPLLDHLKKTPHDGDSAHDLAHLLRVALWAARFLSSPASAEPESPEATVEAAVAAALLHDLVNVPKNHPDRSRASEFSAEAAKPLLLAVGFSAHETSEICQAIRQHSFSRGEPPSTALAKALQDADRLEALGAIGIMRCYSTGVRMGTRYFDPEDPFAKQRPLDDTAFSLDHFYTKLFRLPDTMNTAAGTAEAKERLRPMRAFVESLRRELGEAQEG